MPTEPHRILKWPGQETQAMTSTRTRVARHFNDSAKLQKVTSVLLFALMPVVWEETVQQGRPFTFTGWLFLGWALAAKVTILALRQTSRYNDELDWYEQQSLAQKYGSRWWGMQSLGPYQPSALYDGPSDHRRSRCHVVV